MKPIELKLIPAAGQKAEFLASITPTDDNPKLQALWSNLPPTLILQGYTRDSWSLDTSAKWQRVNVQSVDGRKKLPGFIKYLRDRQKTAYGQFQDSVIVVPFKQMSSTSLSCRVALLQSIEKCPLKRQAQPTMLARSTSSSAPPKKKGLGLLGNLVGAQKRTNQHVQHAAPASAPAESTVANGPSSETSLKTAAQILADFRHDMNQKMLDFDLAPDPTLQVSISLAKHTQKLTESEKPKVTMEVLKYIVYEQAEEVNDEWIAHKEPSEFLDEVTITVYKEGEAPAEVLEDINKAEVPDEVRGQQRALQDEKRKAQEAKLAKFREGLRQQAMQQEEDFAALNQQKRDRRTIEDYEREAKRRKE